MRPLRNTLDATLELTAAPYAPLPVSWLEPGAADALDGAEIQTSTGRRYRLAVGIGDDGPELGGVPLDPPTPAIRPMRRSAR